MKKKVTIAKRSASSKGTANKDDPRFTDSDHFTESSDHFTESIEKKLDKLRWNIQKKVRKFP